MEKKRSKFSATLCMGLALFAAQFGAGNLIFPPFLGRETGSSWISGFMGFFIMDNEYDKAKRYDRFMATHSGTDQPVNAEGLLHPIHIFNKNYYLYAREGDTFKSIGKEVGISWRKLARYNERDKHAVLHKGDIIYLKKKRSKAPKQYKKRPHVIQPGESMYAISQKYGIRLEKLYKMNHLDPNIPVSVGTRLKVR